MGKSHCRHPSRRLLIHLQHPTIAHYAGYSEEEVMIVAKLMIDYLRRPTVHEAFFTKYSSKKFLKGQLIPSLLTLAD